MKKILVVSLLILNVSFTNAQVEAIAASATVDSVINKIKNNLSELISEAETSATVTGFSITSDANILVQNLDIMAKELSGKVFSDLNTSQQLAFSNATALLSQTNSDLKERIADVNSVISGLGSEISRLPFASKRPLLKGYSPSYILNNDAAYDVTLDGSLLNTDEIDLSFGAVICGKTSSVENTVRFSCPAEIFKDTENRWVTGTLKLLQKKAWYNVFGKDKTFEYSLGIMAIQEKFGEYKLLVTERVDSNKKVPRSHNNQHKNSHCQGGSSKVWTYRPSNGCTIDTSSAKIASRSVSSKSSLEGIVNLSSNGFQIRGIVRNNGSCGPFGVPKDGRGRISVSAAWVDICPAKKLVSLPAKQGALAWGNDIAFDLPENYTKFSLEITQLDGTKKIVNNTEAHEWFTTQFDAGGKQIIFKPRKIEDAFN